MQALQKKSPIIFRSTHWVRFSEIDPYGHVSMVHYLNYFMEHRFECARKQLGWDLKKLSAMPVAFVTRSTKIDFIRPLLIDQQMEIVSHIPEFGDRSATVFGEISTGEKTAATIELHLVCFDRKALRACPWPAEIIEQFYVNT